VWEESDTRSAQAWRHAARQHGIVTRRQLLALGYSARSVEHRLARGRLLPVSLGVYAVGWPALNQKRRWMAAVLAGGEGAALSHRSAAALWEVGREEGGRIDVSLRRHCELRRPRIRFHGRPSLRAEDILRRDGIPAASPSQTLLDLATELDRIPLERAVNDADKRGLIDPEALREQLAGYGGWPGVRPLRHLLDKLFFQLSDSDLEIYFRHIVKAAKLPMPLTDGLRYHRTPSAQTRDARRDRAHVMAGMTPTALHPPRKVRYEPSRVRASLTKTIEMLRHRIRL
jgi:hypothetical protein